MFKKLSLALLLGMVLALVLTACGQPTTVVPTDVPPEEAEEEEAAEPAEEAEEEAMDFEGLVFDPGCDAGSTVGSIVAVDELTVEFTLCGSDPAFLSKAAFSAFGIYSAEQIEATGGTGDLNEAPIGTGPYKLDAWNRGESLVYSRNEDYWGEPAIADTLVIRWSTEGAARLLELQSGTVDVIDNPSPDDFGAIRDDSDLQLLERQVLNVLYLAMTNTFTPFDDPLVRQAVAQGIDRQRIVDNFYPGGSSVPTHFTPCAIPNACEGDEWYEFDPEAARGLLADAGFPNGFESAIYYRDVFRGYLPEPGLVAVEFQSQLRDNLGIEVDVVVMESGEFIAESTTGSLDGFYLLGWGADYPHVTNFLDFHFAEANPQFGDNFPEYYDVLADAAQIADPSAAQPLYAEANNAIRDLVPMVPIANGGSAVACRADVDNCHASPLTNEYFAAVDPGGRDTIVFMQNAEPIGLYCGDQTDGESLRPCEQMNEALYFFEVGGTAVEPGLATSCDPNDDLTVWVCSLREGVTFHDGSTFDANDVVVSWSTGLDFESPFHVGDTGTFQYYANLWGLINAPEE